VSDAWDDEGFGAEDDWQGGESVGADLEDEASGFDDPEDDPEEDETVDALDEEGDD
jgi:hypothetical protein